MRTNLLLACLLALPAAAQAGEPSVTSILQVIGIAEGARPVVLETKAGIFKSPNFAPDGKSLLINENGHFYRIALPAGGPRQDFSTGEASGCWGEHGFSPDGKWYAVSCKAAGEHGPDVHIVPAEGGAARRLTHHPISFFHGWSPDGATIAFTSIRDGHTDIYTVPSAGGGPSSGSDEKRLTDSGLNDSAEFSPDGRFVYFNSNRSGSMQLWRMNPDGSAPQQVTDDEFDNWYPHLSPDGKYLAMVSYAKGEATNGHPMNKEVALRLMSLGDRKIHVLARFLGGQGTIDSPNWAPDSKSLAFVSYRLGPDQ